MPIVPWFGIALGAAIVAAALLAALVKYRRIEADWA
jgi:hypothetical protein